MKKRILSVLTICALIVSAASCGGNNAPAATTAAPAQTEAAATESADTAAAPAETKDTEAPAAETEAAPAAEEKVIPEDTPYVIENGITDRMKALADYIDGNRARLAKVFKKAQAGEPITVAYLGGSITQGSSAGPTTCYAFLTTKWLEEKFPESKITYVNAGIGATGSYIGVFRTDRDVLSQNPDLVFIDPVGTGYSRTVGDTDPNIFYSYSGDIISVSDFISRYISKYGRWSSPKYIIGESYGTVRAVGTSQYLLSQYHIALNGMILISTVNDFSTIMQRPGNDNYYVNYIASFAATARYHKKLSKTYQNMKLETFLDKVKEVLTKRRA